MLRTGRIHAFIISATTSLGGAAAGLRNNSSGALNNVGTNGYYWSASPNSSSSVNATNLNFNSSNVNVYNNNNRANGFSVRCVQAFTDWWSGDVS